MGIKESSAITNFLVATKGVRLFGMPFNHEGGFMLHICQAVCRTLHRLQYSKSWRSPLVAHLGPHFQPYRMFHAIYLTECIQQHFLLKIIMPKTVLALRFKQEGSMVQKSQTSRTQIVKNFPILFRGSEFLDMIDSMVSERFGTMNFWNTFFSSGEDPVPVCR